MKRKNPYEKKDEKMKKYMLDKLVRYSLEFKVQALNFINGFFVSAVISPIAWIISTTVGYANKIILRDHDVVAIIVTMVFIDGFVGIWKWMKLSRFNEKKLIIGFIEKMIICLLSMCVFNMFILAAGDKHDDIASYLNLFGTLTILTYPAWSIFKNFFFISHGKFPPIGFMRKMENFDNTADISTIFTQEKSKQDEAA